MDDATNLDFMGLLKALFKLGLLIAVGAAVAGVLSLVKKSKESSPVSYDQWPDVPENPAG